MRVFLFVHRPRIAARPVSDGAVKLTTMTGQVWKTSLFRELNRPLAEVVGGETARHCARLRLETVGDMLRHLPRRYLAGTDMTDLSMLREGDEVAVMARVHHIRDVAGSPDRLRLEATLTDGKAYLNITFFGKKPLIKYWQTQLQQGVRGIFVGKIGAFQRHLQLTHPEFVMLDEQGAIVGRSEKKSLIAALSQTGLIGIYPATRQLPTWKIAECVLLAAQAIADCDDPWPLWLRQAAGVLEYRQAVRCVHQPRTLSEVDKGTNRLLFDEAFTTQLTMAYRRHDAARHTAVPRPVRPGGLLDLLNRRLPFRLTAGQQQVLAEIAADLTRNRPMNRLLQGEVGSGKTVVALQAMLQVVDGGGQAVLLAPTEVLAMQHYRSINAMLGELAAGRTLGAPPEATSVVCLTGGMSAIARRNALLRIASGEAGIVIGTHALLADRVQYADIGLIVVDEQHRFGVEQRSQLATRAENQPHVLVMTATPIPRSVALTIFGDLEVSTLAELPKGRATVTTMVVDTVRQPAWVARSWSRIAEEVAAGRQAFIVCPRIGGDRKGSESGVVEMYDTLVAGPLAGVRVSMLHGQLKDKDDIMARFAAGDIDVLVSTTVIEVGVDIPNATMMVICEAEHFGVSQIHQLRGRIGRGHHPGLCLLLTATETDTPARQRLEAIAATQDGFALADIDLQQRREGDVLGLDQSGSHSSLRLLSVLDHVDLIQFAHDLAARCVVQDPECQTPGFADAVQHISSLAALDHWEQG